jgi:hypothetical protein
VKSLTRSPVVAPSSQLSRLFVELKVLLSGNSRLCALASGVFVRVVALGSSRPGKGAEISSNCRPAAASLSWLSDRAAWCRLFSLRFDSRLLLLYRRWLFRRSCCFLR